MSIVSSCRAAYKAEVKAHTPTRLAILRDDDQCQNAAYYEEDELPGVQGELDLLELSLLDSHVAWKICISGFIQDIYGNRDVW